MGGGVPGRTGKTALGGILAAGALVMLWLACVAPSGRLGLTAVGEMCIRDSIGSCKKIAYLFPKAHAVAYVMMAFRIAWFKVHRPLAFYAAYFSIRAKAFDQEFMCHGMDVCQRKMREIIAKDKAASAVEQDMLTTLEVCYEFYLRGFTFARMDLYRSQAINFTVDEEAKALIPPFVSVAGLGETAAISLAEQCKGRRFISIEEVSAACPKVSKTHIDKLTEAGAFGDLPQTSQMDLFSML